MSPGPRKNAAFAAAGLLLLALAGLLLAAADPLLARLERYGARAEERLGGRLRRAGIVAFWDLDEVRPRDLVSGAGVVTGGTRLAAGRRGRARSFLREEHGFLKTPLHLATLGGRYSFSCWLRFPAVPRNHRIFEYLAVRDGTLFLQLNGQKPIPWPITATGRFVHVAFTVDAPGGRAHFYVGGEEVGQIPLRSLRHPNKFLLFGQDNWNPPPAFDLDEVSLWARPLTPQEVRRLSRLRWSLAADIAFAAALKLRLAESLRGGYRALLLAADLFHPFLHESRIRSSGLPSYALLLSRNDVRSFNKYANEQAENGLNAADTSQKRKVELVAGDQQREAVLELIAGEHTGPEDSAKRTFTLEILGEDGQPERKLFLRPIEGTPYLLKILAGRLGRDCGLPLEPPELCAVSINGTFEGLHLAADISRNEGLPWQEASGPWPAVLRRLPVFRDEVLAEFDRLAAAWAPVLRSDRRSPLSSREILRDIGRQRRLLEETLADPAERSDAALVARAADHVREDLFLGKNAHPSLIVGDLDLGVTRVNGAALSFESLTPALLAGDGRITPPAEKAAPAALRVTIRSGEERRTKDLAFVVLPARRGIPLLRVEAAGNPPIDPAVPCLAEFIEGDGGRSGLLEGKIRLRGNSSLFRPANLKKYYRINLPRPVDVPGLGRTRVLLLTSEWRDVSLMRDKISYDLFRGFSRPGQPRYSPHIRYVELVLNGDYKGVYALTDQVDADLLGFGKKSGATLYKFVHRRSNFRIPRREAVIQEVPDWRDGEHWGPYETFIDFIGRTKPEAFREGVERLIDVENIVDFEILLALTSNFEGQNANLFLARGGAPGSRFFLVPWDYDMTFYKKNVATNYLINRLHRDLPGHGRRVSARWRALRREQLSEEALQERIDGLAAELADAAERNYRRWPLPAGESWEGGVDYLRTFIRERLPLLDAHFTAKEGP